MTTEARTRAQRVGRFDPASYEASWRERWERDELYLARDDDPRPKFYFLTMYPYPSGDLHIGHWYAMTPSDAVARYHRMTGKNVMFPMGFDGFGLPAENAAIERGIHPAEWTFANIERMRGQLRTMGCMFDWSREVVTCDPSYYRWNQWLFLKFYEAGLAYRAMAPVDWCPKDQVVLAREQVEGIDRRCWRCGTQVEKRDLEQWFFRITNYADELLRYEGVDWPEHGKAMQQNWIGRSEGAEIDFPVELPDGGSDRIRVFTTRPDTIYGATFMVLAPEHPLVETLTAKGRRAEVEAYVAAARRQTEIERLSAEREKTGVFIGAHAVNPVTNEQIPIWVADYVLLGYGTGAIMGVPAHDERDFEFARRYDLTIRHVVAPASGEVDESAAFMGHTDDEVLINSGEFSGMQAAEAIGAISRQLADAGLGGPAVTYRLHDWLISRQRYWGTPIPIVYCDEHGAQPVPEDELPISLPTDVDFAPTGVSPLQSHAGFLRASCPVCGADARRETDTMDGFMDSSWYFLRYCSPNADDAPWHAADVARWCPIDIYTGGAEHMVMHLFYFRFFTKALRDMGMLGFDEPTKAMRNQGQILGGDKLRMSKSRGNVENPDALAARYGSDTVRLFLMFIGPWDQGGPWNPTGIEGISRFLGRVWQVAQADLGPGGEQAPPPSDALPGTAEELSRALIQATHQTIAGVTAELPEFRFNTAIAKLMELTNVLMRSREAGLSGTEAYRSGVESLLLLLAPMAPHISEELWARRGGEYSIHQQQWPAHDPSLAASDTIELPVQVDGRLRDRLILPRDTPAERIEELALASERVQAYLGDRPPHRVIQVPGKLVNVVTPRD
jgi:leucyl-tRNA synthetase